MNISKETTASHTITCYDVFDRPRAIRANRIAIRLCAYGFILNQNAELLLVHMKSTKKLWLPGGGVEVHESLEEGLQRETLEETGVDIRVGECVHTMERFFYYEPLDEAYRAIMHFFLCDARTADLAPQSEEPEEATTDPQWIPLAHFHRVTKQPTPSLQSPLNDVYATCSGIVQDYGFRRLYKMFPHAVANGVVVNPRHRFQALGPSGRSVGSGETAQHAKEAAQTAGVMAPLVLPTKQ